MTDDPNKVTETPVEETETPVSTETAEQNVHSQAEVPVVSEEEKEARRQAFLKRQERKQWKARLADAERTGASPEDVAAIQSMMEEKGLAGDDKEVARKQAELMAESAARMASGRKAREREVLRQAANETLVDTLKDLGYKPGTAAFNAAGHALFSKHGIENPDLYADQEQIRASLEDIAKDFVPSRKGGDPVTVAVTAKAGAPRPSSTSRHPASAVTDEVRAFAKERAVSVEKAKAILDKQKALPSTFRPTSR